MRIFIFEGIATSGKSTLIEELTHSLDDKKIVVVGEPETHIPIMKDTRATHLNFFIDLLHQKAATNADLIIFDRLYLTQAYRAQVGLAPYSEVEALLAAFQPLTIFLRVKDEAIAERILQASQHREDRWKHYIRTKGETIEQIAQYYINQQASQLELLKRSTIPYKIFDTTEHGYTEITKQLVRVFAVE